ANVLIAMDDVDLGSSILEPLKPLRTHLVLADGVLTLRELDARTGQGQLGGTVQLDGRDAQALWTADLHWSGVQLESWVHQKRADNAPPYATGRLNGQARVAGQGKSTAAILGSLRGGVRMQLVNGTISHLAVEAAGLDIAQGLGVLIKGDDALPIQCNVVDLVADQGVLRPRVLVLDTRDSTLWVDGSLSLATEAMDLRVVVTPKDFSPLALRTPVHVRGSFADPSVSLEKSKLGARLGAAAALAFLNPLAALIPLVDVGSSDDAKRGGDDCRALSARIAANPVLQAPRPATK
ncbi:MAG: AsmA-like C-terminal region-containing protein, partial [Rhizobacter sp.]